MNAFGTALRLVITLGFLSGLTAVWAEVQMKSRDGQSRLNNRTSSAKSRVANRSHLILDFPEAPTPETARQLSARGMRVVAYLPVTGMIVGVDGEANLQGLNVNGFDALQPEDKLSHELALAAGGEGRGVARSARRSFYVVEFHGDIPWAERRSLVTESGIEIKDHRDLVGDHMLVRGTLDQMQSLAEWDEVAYIFPASGELVTGLPLVGCLGGATEAGQVGQLTQRIGEGWDGPGLNSANLTYSMQGAVSTRLAEGQALAEIQRAMAAWSAVVKVDFKRTINTNAMKNINILFGSSDHGDPYPFDGAGRVLAHTFYPSAPNPEPLAGDLHFDTDENWNIGN
ncbi:MAG: matrixin family metalloprotease, partial [Saprospiraceae bacterium]